MLEAEAAFVRTLPQLNSITAGLLHAVVSHVLSACRSDLEVFDAHACDVQKAADQKAPSKSSVTDHLEALLKLDGKYASMTYTEAIRHLEPVRDKFKNTTDWGHGLHIEHERFLAEQVVGAPIFITDYPRDIKPFYMRSNDRDGATYFFIKFFDLFEVFLFFLGQGRRSLRLICLCLASASSWAGVLGRSGFPSWRSRWHAISWTRRRTAGTLTSADLVPCHTAVLAWALSGSSSSFPVWTTSATPSLSHVIPDAVNSDCCFV